MKQLSQITFALLLCCSVSIVRSQERPAPANSSSTTNRPEEVVSLKWLTGAWEIKTKESRTIEEWKLKDRNNLIGTSLTTNKAGDTLFFEKCLITKTDSGICYIVTIGNNPPVAFKMIKNAEEVVFENKNNEFPQRIIYKHPDPAANVLNARIEGTLDGETKKEEFKFVRSPYSSSHTIKR